MQENKTILLIDDNTLNRRLVSAMLKGLPLQIVEWDNGRDALSFLQTKCKDIDLVLLDIGMPDLSGTDICKLVRSSTDADLRGLPLIAYTAHAMNRERELYLNLGFNDILLKPMSKNDLMRAIGRYISADLQNINQIDSRKGFQ